VSIELFEAWDSGRFSDGISSSYELRYIITGTDDETDVLAALIGSAPDIYYGMRRMAVEAEPLGGGIWQCTVPYEGKNETVYTFETGGSTQHITQSLATIARHAPSGFTAPDFFGAIGVNGDSIDGVDVTVPVFNFTETYRFPGATVSGTFKMNLFNCTGKVNNASFRGFAAGEVLFMGASGTKTGIDDWEISYKFAASPNVTSLAVGGGITVSAKKGWEYLWVRFADAEDTTAKALVKRPVAAYVEQVYPTANFSTLGIGVI
jgi:hypothetical protein